MNQKPSNLTYGQHDSPPFPANILLGIQHASLAMVFIVYPLILVAEVNGSTKDAEGAVTATILVMAIGTFLQSLGRKGIGSGFLAVQIASPIYLPVAIMAAHTGGIGLACGMTVIGGLFSLLLSRYLKYLRPLFPAEVCGVGVMMLGISMIGPGVGRFAGIHGAEVPDLRALAVGFITISLISGLSIWVKGAMRLYSAVIGLLAGYAAALVTGLIKSQSIDVLLADGLVAFPVLHLPVWSFEWVLLVPFLMTAVVNSLDTIACMITCQKINEPDWVRADMKSISGGVLADGAASIAGGALGTIGCCVSSSHVALSSATGATSRKTAQLAALLLLFAAFLPPVSKLLAVIPAPIIGAVLIYAAAFLITSGMELIVSRMLDTRRIFMIGFSIIIGIVSIQFQELIAQLPPAVSSIVGSPFAISSLSAIILNLLFKIGTSLNVSLSVEPRLENIASTLDFLENRGAGWGARREVIRKAENAVNELLETLFVSGYADGPLDMNVRFSEHCLDIIILYKGRPLVFSDERPQLPASLDDDAQAMPLSLALVRQYADRVTADRQKESQRISMRFEQ
jgi:NCS2 family nucleobase:cation symporter-2